eukprot:TRINITY_DN11771_c0_g1_i5.p1 TRINITY_DN11771_c0_g1~~TRINITY_DN11771_c0_g1_i5.p1  ORF type:complete len:144 (-),score=31.88 TRINITY_DN11771_c0_g1_i5:426-857(-)
MQRDVEPVAPEIRELPPQPWREGWSRPLTWAGAPAEIKAAVPDTWSKLQRAMDFVQAASGAMVEGYHREDQIDDLIADATPEAERRSKSVATTLMDKVEVALEAGDNRKARELLAATKKCRKREAEETMVRRLPCGVTHHQSP